MDCLQPGSEYSIFAFSSADFVSFSHTLPLKYTLGQKAALQFENIYLPLRLLKSGVTLT